MPATVLAIHLNRGSRRPLDHVGRVEAIEQHGLDGDRHAKRPGQRRAVLIMTKEDLDAFGLQPGDVREQVTVQDFDLYGPAKGARVAVGGAVLELGGPCAPCERMNEVKTGLRAAIAGRRGRFATVVTGGTIAVDDTITVVTPASA